MTTSMYSCTGVLFRMAALLGVGQLAACAADGDASAALDPEGPVVAQLARASETLAARGLPLKIVGYTAAGALDSEDAIRGIKTQILDDSALVPQYDGMNATSLRLQSIHDRMQAFAAGEDSLNVVDNISSIMFPEIRVGQKVLDVEWEEGGRNFETKLVYDENGLVYDNLLSNVAIVDIEEVEQASPPPNPAGGLSAAPVALATAEWQIRFLTITITWVTGGERGKINFYHKVITCDNWVSFCNDGGSADAYMTGGSASGQTARNALIYPRVSRLAWGYGWATPTAGFTISFDARGLTFSVSLTGLGSAGSGTGVHPIS